MLVYVEVEEKAKNGTIRALVQTDPRFCIFLCTERERERERERASTRI